MLQFYVIPVEKEHPMTRLPLAFFLLVLAAATQADMGVLALGTWVQRNGVLVLTIEEAGAARKLTYRTRGPDGKFMKGDLTLVTMGDGKDSPMLVDGKPTGQSLAIRKVDANHTLTVIRLNGKDCGTSRAEISADGKVMKSEDEYTNTACGMVGKKTVNLWDRK
jgi:hypothetical protein